MNKKKVFFLIGLPGSGKSTLSKYLTSKFNFSVISSNTILDETKNLNEHFLRNEYVDQGIDIPNDIYVSLVSRCLRKNKNDKFIIEGFPYNLNQLKLAEEMLQKNEAILCGVIYLKVDEEILYKRLINRKICPKCGTSFNNDVELCPDCNVSTIKRTDDKISIIDKRIKNQKQNLQDVINYYKGINKLLEFNKMDLQNINLELEKTFYKF